MQRDPRFKQGVYKPINSEKFINKTPIYRSSWERKFMYWCDTNPNVLAVGSENIIVPYKSPIDNKVHRYYVDNFVIIKEGDKTTKYLIEIKPKKQTEAPIKSNKKKKTTIIYEQATWAVNQAKWKAATDYAAKRGYSFLLLTEEQLFNK